MNRFFSFFWLIICLISCNDKSAEKKNIEQIDIYEREYYPSGRLKKEIKYINGNLLNTTIIYYDSSEKIRKRYHYLNNKLDGEFVDYDNNNQILFQSYYKEGAAIGPTYYFSKGILRLYNERDLKGEIYYVKKYDTITHKLIKEEGICLSPNRIVKQPSAKIQELIFFYAEPDGYKNELKALIDGQDIKIDTLKGHIGLVKLKVPDDIGKVVKIFSILKFKTAIICQDSLQELIH
jgi:hypothetical protein